MRHTKDEFDQNELVEKHTATHVGDGDRGHDDQCTDYVIRLARKH
jgi:hypothetical protein